MSEIADNANANEQTLSPPSATVASTQSGAGSSGSSSSSSGQIADHSAFIQYLKQFIPALLDANLASATAEFEKCLNEKSSVECIKKFLSDQQCRTLIIQRFYTKGLYLKQKKIFIN